MLPRALPNHNKDLQTITQDFVFFVSGLEFTPAHPRAFSEANAQDLSKVVCSDAKWACFQAF